MRLRVVATSPSGSVWRLASGTVQRTGTTATAWFLVDHRRDPAAASATSRVHYRFDCGGRRVTPLERVALGPDGRVLRTTGATAESPAGRGTFLGTLLEAACG